MNRIIVSHIIVETCMQGDIERKTYGSFLSSAGRIYSESGIPGFYRGATFRYGRMVCAVFILDTLKGTFVFVCDIMNHNEWHLTHA